MFTGEKNVLHDEFGQDLVDEGDAFGDHLFTATAPDTKAGRCLDHIATRRQTNELVFLDRLHVSI